MFSIEASDAERLIKISWSGQVHLDEMRRCAEEIGVIAAKMRPGFRLLADMTDLESMDSAGAPYIGSVMDFCVTRQVEHVVRVIPDPRKDIGLNIMSYFHYGSKVRVTICENLADAMQQLAEWAALTLTAGEFSGEAETRICRAFSACVILTNLS
jgi:hypothetical protein